MRDDQKQSILLKLIKLFLYKKTNTCISINFETRTITVGKINPLIFDYKNSLKFNFISKSKNFEITEFNINIRTKEIREIAWIISLDIKLNQELVDVLEKELLN